MTLEELKTKVNGFISQNPQFELCRKLLNEYADAVLAYARISGAPVGMQEMMSILARSANIQHRLRQKMPVHNEDDKDLLKGLLEELNEATIGPVSKTA